MRLETLVRRRALVVCLPLLAACKRDAPAGRPDSAAPTAGTAVTTPPSATDTVNRLAAPTGSLVLTDDDIARVKRVLPGLAEASRRGPKDANAYVATLDVPFDQVVQVLTNMSVAFTAVQFEEWSKELKAAPAEGDSARASARAGTSAAFTQSVAAEQRQLQQITQRYAEARQGGRSALEINKDVVRRNLDDVRALVAQMQSMNPAAMPFHR